MGVIEQLVTGDKQLFLFLNGLNDHYFDHFMYMFSAMWVWIPLYVSVLYYLIKNKKKESVWLILALVLCIVIADQVSSGLIKQAVQRLRPTHNPEFNGLVHIVNNYRGGQFGFVSSHAANTFGFALLSSLFIRQRLYTVSIMAWSLLTCYSRIYLGVHYPLDIAGGMIVGALAAVICFLLILKFRPQSMPNLTTEQKLWPSYVLAASILAIAIYSAVI